MYPGRYETRARRAGTRIFAESQSFFMTATLGDTDLMQMESAYPWEG